MSTLRQGKQNLENVAIPIQLSFEGEEIREEVRRHPQNLLNRSVERHSSIPKPPIRAEGKQDYGPYNVPNQRRRGSTSSNTDLTDAGLPNHPYVRELSRSFKAQSHRIRQLEDELALTKAALQAEQSTLHSTRKLLEEKTAELQAANAFLCQTDSVACGDVVNLAETLNYDIQQVSAQITNICGAFELGNLSRSEAGQAFHAQNYIASKTGVDLRKTVEHPDIKNHQEFRAAWIDFMIQTFLVKSICFEVLDTEWSPDARLDKAVSIVYKRITQSNAVRSIAGKWRTLTHTAVSQEPFPAKELIENALCCTRRVLIAFGGIDLPSEESFIAMFHDDMEPVINNLEKLNSAIKEKVSSCRIVPWIANPGSRFDRRSMVDSNAPDSPSRRSEEHRVFASVSLGLLKSPNLVQEYQVLVKPKVVLEALLHSFNSESDAEAIDESSWGGIQD